jgi:hypothetical protein
VHRLLEAQLRTQLAAVNALIARELPALNELLRSRNVTQVISER